MATLRTAGVPVSGPHGRGYRGVDDGAVLLCVPDDAIPAAAGAVAAGPLVGHCSGASGLDVLGDREGFSLHPLMTVTWHGADFAGVTAAIAGSTGRSLAAARALAGALGLHPVQVADADRVAYHAAASFAANFLVTVESAAAQLMSTAGLDREVLLPLARAALENWGRGGPSALTGPVARGDERTIDRHRDAVRDRAPELAELFDALVGATRLLATQNVTVRNQPAEHRIGSAEPPTAGSPTAGSTTAGSTTAGSTRPAQI